MGLLPFAHTDIFSLFIIANSTIDFQQHVISTEKARLQRDYYKISKKSKQHLKKLGSVYKFSENVTISVLAIVSHIQLETSKNWKHLVEVSKMNAYFQFSQVTGIWMDFYCTHHTSIQKLFLTRTLCLPRTQKMQISGK